MSDCCALSARAGGSEESRPGGGCVQASIARAPRDEGRDLQPQRSAGHAPCAEPSRGCRCRAPQQVCCYTHATGAGRVRWPRCVAGTASRTGPASSPHRPRKRQYSVADGLSRAWSGLTRAPYAADATYAALASRSSARTASAAVYAPSIGRARAGRGRGAFGLFGPTLPRRQRMRAQVGLGTLQQPPGTVAGQAVDGTGASEPAALLPDPEAPHGPKCEPATAAWLCLPCASCVAPRHKARRERSKTSGSYQPPHGPGRTVVQRAGVAARHGEWGCASTVACASTLPHWVGVTCAGAFHLRHLPTYRGLLRLQAPPRARPASDQSHEARLRRASTRAGASGAEAGGQKRQVRPRRRAPWPRMTAPAASSPP